MISSQSRRPGLRQSSRLIPTQMEIEEPLPRSFSKERATRNFGTNIINQMPRAGRIKPTQKLAVKSTKSTARGVEGRQSLMETSRLS